MKQFLLISLFLIILQTAFAQYDNYAELKLYTGFVAPHRIGMESMADKNIKGVELNFLIHDKSDNPFQQKYNFPFKGYGVSYDNHGNPDVLGSAFSAYTFMEFGLWTNRHFSINYRISPGLAYLTKKYDSELNPENIAIGTNLCFYFNVSFSALVAIPKSEMALRMSSGLLHYSNGSVRKPNLGLNQVYFSVGLSRLVHSKSEIKSSIYLPEKFNPSEFWAMATLTSSDEYSRVPEGRGGGFLCSTIAAGYNYQYGLLGKIGISADLFYNSNLQYYYDTNWDTLVLYYPNVSQVLRAGVSIGHQLIYNRLELISFAGFYYYNKIKPGDHFYTRIGARYYVTDFMFVNLTLKAFGFKAQYIEPGIGFSFRKTKK